MNLISSLVISKKNFEIQQCHEINDLLSQILDDNHLKLKEIYTVLQTVINILSTKKGPKSFKRLLDQMFQFMKIYSYDRIKAYEQQIVILNLTYYQKLFKQNLSIKQKLQIIIIFAVSNIHIYLKTNDSRRLNSVDDKIQQGLSITTNLKIKQNYLENVFTLLLGIAAYLKGQNKRAKSTFANLITKIISQNKQLLKSSESLEIMAIVSFYSFLNLSKMDQSQLALYYLKKTEQFTRKMNICPQELIKKIRQMKQIDIRQYKQCKNTKLTRIQNKMQILNKKTKTWNSKTMKTKIYNVSKNNNFDENIVNQQLKNIFTLKDTKATMYKFKKDNMRYLESEEVKLLGDIQKQSQELKEIYRLQGILDRNDDIKNINNNITQLNTKKQQLKQQFLQLKQKYLHELRPIKVINRFMKTYFICVSYQKMYYLYNFLHGNMMSTAKIFLLSRLMKKRNEKYKKFIKKTKFYINSVLHFVQIFEIVDDPKIELLIYKKKDPGYYIKIYPLQNKKQYKGLFDQKTMQKGIFDKLKIVPFYYQFEVDKENNKLLSWGQYLNKKNLLVVYYVRKFIQKLNKKWKNKQYQEEFNKIHVSLKFKQTVIIQTTLFACVTKITNNNSFLSVEPKKQKYQAYIFTIERQKYANKLYNIKINKNLVIQTGKITQQMAQNILQSQFVKSLQQNVNSIKRIQQFVRYLYCRKKVNNLKSKCKIVVFVQGYDVYTYCKNSSGQTYIIVENIVTKDREIVETMMDFSFFKQIYIIKDKLLKQRTCKDKIRLTFKFMWTKYFVSKLKNNYKETTVITDFQINFRNRLIFSKAFNSYFYKKKQVNQKIVFSLTVENLVDFPRPYVFRIFTFHNGINCVDIKHRIFNREKLFYQKNANKLNQLINFTSNRQMEILSQNSQIDFLTRHYSRNSRNSRYSRNSRNSICSRSSKNNVQKSNTNFASENDIKSDINLQVFPKIVSKKLSMLNRFKNRRSYELTLENQSIFGMNNSSIKDNDNISQTFLTNNQINEKQQQTIKESKKVSLLQSRFKQINQT